MIRRALSILVGSLVGVGLALLLRRYGNT